MKFNILLTDILFPNKYAKWRIEEIKSFIELYDTDILVTHKVNFYAGIKYGVDYEAMKQYFGLYRYNILIFNPKYNHLNKYNASIDGTLFNNEFFGDYLFTKSDGFYLPKYSCVYHIFLMNYSHFNKYYSYPLNKQFIHLYPGGGFLSSSDLKNLSKEVGLISTQGFTTNILNELGFHNFIPVYGGCFLQKNVTVTQKNINENVLTICFSSLGPDIEKGANFYVKIVNEYIKRNPKDNIKFISIGNCPKNCNIVNYKPMSQAELDLFYRKNVDVLLNLETGVALHGWPLGIEALLQGVVLVTTDVHNLNKYFKFSEDMIGFIDTIESIFEIIKKLHDDRNLLSLMSKKSQSYAHNLFSFENQQQKIFKFMESILNNQS